jgi:hypothetical protein
LEEDFLDDVDFFDDLGEFDILGLLNREKSTSFIARTTSLVFLVVLMEKTLEWGSSAILYRMVYFLLMILSPYLNCLGWPVF